MLFLAIHNGHNVSEWVKGKISISDSERLREEDPYTCQLVEDKDNYIVQLTSRFEYDLNRAMDKAVYQVPSDCWNLPIYRNSLLTQEEVNIALSKYDKFYKDLDVIIDSFLLKYDRIIVWDIHSYNHRRMGANAEFDDNEQNPEIILGINNYIQMSQSWKPLIDFIQDSLQTQSFQGCFPNRSLSSDYLDVRQNIKFPGGNLSKYINSKYSNKVCCIAIEFKKIWMNEWTHEIDETCFSKLKEIFNHTCSEVLKRGI